MHIWQLVKQVSQAPCPFTKNPENQLLHVEVDAHTWQFDEQERVHSFVTTSKKD